MRSKQGGVWAAAAAVGSSSPDALAPSKIISTSISTSVSLPTASLFLQAGSLCFVVSVSILILCKVFGSRRRVGIEEEEGGRPREPAAAAVERARRRRKKRRDRVVEEWDKLLDAALESGAL